MTRIRVYCGILSNSWILFIIWLFRALNRTPNIDCYWVGAVPKEYSRSPMDGNTFFQSPEALLILNRMGWVKVYLESLVTPIMCYLSPK